MDRERIYKKLAKYFSGESSPDEIDEINKWLNADTGNKIVYDEVKGMWESSKPIPKTFNTEKAWQNVKSKTINSTRPIVQSYPSNNNKLFFNPLFLRIAASVILFVLLAVYAANQIINSGVYTQRDLKEIIADKNEIRKVRLEDGTVVTLNSESGLRIPETFGEEDRTVQLSGEAYFEVAHNEQKPFFVKTNNAVIKVLGTKFIVTAWNEDSDVTVAVAEGRVNFNSNSGKQEDAVFLTKDEMSTVTNDTYPMKPVKINVEKYYSFWLTNELNFYNASFKSVIQRLEMKYNVDIAVADISILSKHLTADFKNESLSEVLNTISIALNLGYSVNKNKIVFNYLTENKKN